jgi:hypothetical protein
VLIKLNVTDALDAVLAVVPSMKAPTVSPLAEGGFAIETVVDNGREPADPAAQTAGASDILELPISKIVPSVAGRGTLGLRCVASALFVAVLFAVLPSLRTPPRRCSTRCSAATASSRLPRRRDRDRGRDRRRPPDRRRRLHHRSTRRRRDRGFKPAARRTPRSGRTGIDDTTSAAPTRLRAP